MEREETPIGRPQVTASQGPTRPGESAAGRRLGSGEAMRPAGLVQRLLKRWRRYWATPVPLTFSQLTETVKAGNVVAKGSVYDMLGMVDLGNPKMIETIVLELTKPEKEDELRRVVAIALCLKVDEVFALRYDEIVLNTLAGADNLTPLQRVILYNEDTLRAVGVDNWVDAIKSTHAIGRDGTIYTPTLVSDAERPARVALIQDALRPTNFEEFVERLAGLMIYPDAVDPHTPKTR